jgi:hypothetical protein
VLATMVPDGAPVPDWPTEVPDGAVRRSAGGRGGEPTWTTRNF